MTATATKSRKSAKAKSSRTVRATQPKAALVAAKVNGKEPRLCWCGCNQLTSPRRETDPATGKTARAEPGYLADEIAATLPNNDARDEFAHHLELERKKIKAAAAKATKK
jgi:hypothetical protein